ncbi:MAG: ribonuclease Z [Lachnospiraceae bacterium]|jgi:ribonuclease Z|nr:ribonuclease Z [Lachnospiraceae bacterium]
MLEVILMGTGGMMPLPYRYLTSMIARYNGSNILIDCGEGTQVAMKKAGLSPKPIDVICFTHYHADHISGLPGMLLTLGNAERTEPVVMIGPRGLTRVVPALRTIAPELPFDISLIEIQDNFQVFDFGEYKIEAFRVNHNVICYGYNIVVDRSPKFDPERAKAQNIPLKAWNPLQKGNDVTIDGITYTPDMVLGPARKGLKLTYCTDSRPTDFIVENAKGADLFICEGMYGEPDKLEKAKEHKHMTFYEAAEMAKDAGVKEMWLTHFSPSLNHPEEYKNEVRKIFENTVVSKDGQRKDLLFEED